MNSLTENSSSQGNRTPVGVSTVWMLACTFILLQAPLWSQEVQRLIIPSAEVSIGPGAETIIKTYCTDYGITGPTLGQRYEYSLTGGNSALVIVGGRSMSLQEAIDLHKLRLETPTATVESEVANARLFRGLSGTSGVSDADIRRELASLSPKERIQRLSLSQNEGHLKIINLSREKIIFRARNAAVGVADSPPPLIPERTTSQGSLFISQIQHRLKDQGYDLQADGVLGPSTRTALRDFQEKNGLQATGDADEGVARKLADVEDINALRTKVPNELLILRLSHDPKGEEKDRLLTDLEGNNVYTGREMHSMIDAIVAAAAQNGTPTYIDAPHLSNRERDDLAKNLRLSDSENPIEIFPRPGDSSVPRDVFLNEGARLERFVTDSEQVRVGEKQGWFRSVITFLTNAHGVLRRISVEVWTKTSEQMSTFLESIRAYSSGSETDNPSIAVMVARGRKQIALGGGKRGDVDVLIQSATYRFWANVERSTILTAGI